jgi:hypothetical protein
MREIDQAKILSIARKIYSHPADALKCASSKDARKSPLDAR